LENDVNELRSKLQNLKIETQNNLLVSNSQLQFHQKELEELKTSQKMNEKEKELRDDKAKNVARETSEVIQSIKNVYFRCQSTMRNKSQLIANTNSTNPTLLPSGGGGGSGGNGSGGGTGNGTSSSSSTGPSTISNLSELLSLYLDLVHSRVSDLIEISNEYKVNPTSGSVYSLTLPSQFTPGGALSTNLDTGGGGLGTGGAGGGGGFMSGGNSQFETDRGAMSRSAPSSDVKGKRKSQVVR
jgi:uncharacterized membrane protein